MGRQRLKEQVRVSHNPECGFENPADLAWVRVYVDQWLIWGWGLRQPETLCCDFVQAGADRDDEIGILQCVPRLGRQTEAEMPGEARVVVVEQILVLVTCDDRYVPALDARRQRCSAPDAARVTADQEQWTFGRREPFGDAQDGLRIRDCRRAAGRVRSVAVDFFPEDVFWDGDDHRPRSGVSGQSEGIRHEAW